MEDKKPSGSKLEAFFAGKGFYIVLVLCVSVIGVSTWSMLTGGQRQTAEEPAMAVAGVESAQPTLDDAAPPHAPETPAPTPEQEIAPEPSPEPTAAPSAAQQPPAAVPASGSVEQQPSYFIWPVTGDVETPYAMASLLFDTTMRDWRTHDGLDIAAEIGSQVRATADGTVAAVYADDAYGTTVVLRHAGGLESRYSNLAASPTVSVGQRVSVGEILGAVGDTALCEIGEVSHLHFSMTKDGESVDPGSFLP
ncbi:MAG: peptidoglycan DD-metalloendopeptidase family protein [Oscillospiraceae bacterium]|nr:peptidoglycan DD-metalloendopeptidase family protein [Oscillospiraceae bacterium]